MALSMPSACSCLSAAVTLSLRLRAPPHSLVRVLVAEASRARARGMREQAVFGWLWLQLFICMMRANQGAHGCFPPVLSGERRAPVSKFQD